MINQTTHFTQSSKELQEAFINYLEAYFVHRDMPGTFAMFGPSLSGFGTGIGETGYSPEEMTNGYQRDFEQAPNPIFYTLLNYQIQMLSASIGIVFGELDLSTTISDHTLKLHKVRLSTVFQKKEQLWLLEHMHISFPAQIHDKDEAYPLKEIEERTELLEKMVLKRTHDLEATREQLERLAETDPMTTLFNRMKLDQILTSEIQRAKRYMTTFSIALFDLDNFKDINDTHGHQVGDIVLAELAKVIRHRVRNTDMLGRWGGDEFLIISPETNLEDACLLAETIRITLGTHNFNLDMKITSSFGVTTWHEDDSFNSLIDRADKALYQAKRNGKNQVCS